MRAGGKPQLSSPPTIWGKGDPRLLAAGVGVPRPSDVLQHPGVDAGHLRKRPRLGRRGGLGRTESLGRWARVACPSCPPAVYSVCSFDPSSCPVKPPLSKSPVPVPLSPPHSPKKISYHCCICNLWIRGLSIYYYWLIIIIIIIIDYVNLPPVCLSRWVSEVTLGVEDALVPLRAPRLCCPGDSGGGHWLSPTTLGAGPTARSPLSVLLQAAGALWLLAWGTWGLLLLRHWLK